MQEFNLTLNQEQLRVVRQALTFATGIGNLSVQDTQYSNEVYLKLDRVKPLGSALNNEPLQGPPIF